MMDKAMQSGSSATGSKRPADHSRQRAKQARAIETNAQLLDAATDLFSTKGFEGTSVRQIEEHANVQRGLLAYHFGNKDSMWRAVVDRIFGGLKADMTRRIDVLTDVAPTEAAPALLRAFVRYSASHPALNRMIMQESVSAGWRIEYFVHDHIRPLLDSFQAVAGASQQTNEEAAQFYYLLVGAGAFIFSVEHECEALFGFNPRSEDFVEKYAENLVRLMYPAKT